MKSFFLRIIAPDGVRYEGMAESVTVRTIDGYVGILAGHTNFTTALASGEARIVIDGVIHKGDCSRGILSVLDGEVTLLPSTFSINFKEES